MDCLERRQEPVGTDDTDQDQPDGHQQPQQTHLSEQRDTGEAQEDVQERTRRLGAHTRATPGAVPLGEQGARPGREIDELIEQRHPVGDEVPTAEHEDAHDDDPHQDDDLQGARALGGLLGGNGCIVADVGGTTISTGAAPGIDALEAAQLQGTHLGVIDLADPCQGTPATEDRREPAQVPCPGADDLEDQPDPSLQQGDHGIHERGRHRLGHDPQRVPEPVVRQHRPDAMTTGEAVVIRSRDAGREIFAVSGGCGRVDQHTCAEGMGTPAQVEVFAPHDDRLVETAERAEEVGAQQGDGTRDCEDVAHCVVLFLVVLTGLGQVGHQAGLVSAEADVEDAAGIVPVEELRPDHTGIRPERLFDQATHAIGRESDVVVADQQVRAERRVVEDHVRVLREALVGNERYHDRLGNDVVHPRSDRNVTRCVDHDHFE